MDIKLINNKKKIINIVAFIILIITSLGIYFSYGSISEEIEERKSEISYFDENPFLRTMISSNYIIYHKLFEEKAGVLLTKDKTFVNIEEATYIDPDTGEKISNEKILKQFNEYYNDAERQLESEYRNLEYYGINNESKVEITNSKENLKSILSGSEELNGKYRFYVVLNYDKFGNLNISNIYSDDSIDKFQLESSIQDANRNNKKMEGELYKVEPIKNTTFVYAVPKELKYQDSIYFGAESSKEWTYYHVVGRKANIFIMIIAILTLLIPNKFINELIGTKQLKKLPMEINLYLGWILIFNQISYTREIILDTINGEMFNNNFWLLSIGNTIFWTMFLYLVVIETAVLKNIVTTGFEENVKSKSLIYKGLVFLRKKWNEFYKTIENIDLREKQNKKLKKIIVINGIVVSLISCAWFFGIIGVVVYSLIIYRMGYKYIEDVRAKYGKLLEATNEIANGNLEVTIEDNLGVFNPMKEELKKIQNGFKKAVDEEVKSQKMKTELISNVSHDLKTPLTSIITYVDLLKDENIDDEKKKQYVDTIDRKSQRLKSLIEDLFEVSKVNSGNVRLNLMDVDVVSLIKQTEFELQDKIQESDLKVKFTISDEKIIRSLDSQRTFRVFENLILNATKYAIRGSRVYIDIEKAQEKAKIVIKNVSATEIDFTGEEIVERFSRGDKSRNTEGSGLGLAIAKSFVELQGGSFKVEIDGDLFKVIITL